MLANGSYGNLTNYAAYYYTDLDKVIITIIMPIVVTIGIIGNIMTIIVIASKKCKYTYVNIYLANLAVADTLYLLVAPTWIWNSYVKSPIHNWYDMGEGSDWFCPFYCFIKGAAIKVALFTILWLSIDRYMAVCKPLKFRKSGFGIWTKSIKICGIIWLLGLSWNVSYLASFSAKFVVFEGLNFTRCTPRNQNLSNILLFVEVTIVLLAFMVVLFLYTAMLISLRKARVTSANSTGKKFRSKSEMKIFLTLVVTVIVYVVCVYPKYLYTVLLTYRITIDILPMNIFNLMCIINSSVNPLIYNVLNNTFRRAFRDVYCRCNQK
ncbi:kappa-type opioid receptor-like [Anneissia japonica]|uniref:kappa-type opioid receptor-like n=1 Tax=Anneissia japonica TaxID=1529436 RepID=UPI0014257048|nr:kappa-type opioid receptor-like [Anneissia japonica]